MIRILIVDDHALVRAGFRMILSGQPGFDVVGEAGSGEEGIQRARELAPDVVLMDMHLPGISGLEACARIRRLDPAPRVLALSALEAMPAPKAFLEAGASGFLAKACPAEELVRAVRRVGEGGRYLDPAAAQAIALATIAGDDSARDALTPRELDILIALAKGQDMPEIAARLHISVKTVASHKYNAYTKLGLENDVALAHYAIRHGLIPSPAGSTAGDPQA